MINIEIPGYGNLYIENVLMDYNGTIASGGKLISSLKNIIEKLSNKANLYVITADTFGTVSRELENLPIEIIKIKKNDERLEKLEALKKLGPKKTIAYGNGNNDTLMLKEASVGICILGDEGASKEVLESSDLIIGSIEKGLNLLVEPNKLKATLRY